MKIFAIVPKILLGPIPVAPAGDELKRGLMDILCCPVCKGDLSLSVKKETGNQIIEGKLRCASCDVDYPIEDGIPNLLPPAER